MVKEKEIDKLDKYQISWDEVTTLWMMDKVICFDWWVGGYSNNKLVP